MPNLNLLLELNDDEVAASKRKRVEGDEIWSFTYAKQKNLRSAKSDPLRPPPAIGLPDPIAQRRK